MLFISYAVSLILYAVLCGYRWEIVTMHVYSGGLWPARGLHEGVRMDAGICCNVST